MNEFLNFAQELAKKGSRRLSENFGRLQQSDIETKGAHDLVTRLDKEIEQMYITEIKKKLPGHGIIGEEGGSENEKAEFVWVLDPLDGTRNYSIEIPFYGTTICLLWKGEPVVAALHLPAVDKLYSAAKDQGAFLNEKMIHVSSKSELKKSSVFYCHTADERGIISAEKYAARLKLAAFSADRLRSAAGEMGLVAEGLGEAYLLDGLPVWDLAGGALLVREAGGRATDYNGKEWKPGDQTILVSNGSKIHEEILEILKAVL